MNILKTFAGAIALLGLANSGIAYAESFNINSRGPLWAEEQRNTAPNGTSAHNVANVNTRGPVMDTGNNLVSFSRTEEGHVASRGPLRSEHGQTAMPGTDRDIVRTDIQ